MNVLANWKIKSNKKPTSLKVGFILKMPKKEPNRVH